MYQWIIIIILWIHLLSEDPRAAHLHQSITIAIWWIPIQAADMHISISELPLSFNRFPYKLQSCILLLVNYHCHLMDSLTSWKQRAEYIFVLVNYYWHLMDSPTSWKDKASIFVLVNYHCHLMDLLTSWRHRGGIFVLVNYHCHLMDSHTSWRYKAAYLYQWITTVIWWIRLLPEDTRATNLDQCNIAIWWIYLLPKDTRAVYLY